MEERNYPHRPCQDCLKKGKINPSSMTISCYYCYVDLSKNPLSIFLCNECFTKRNKRFKRDGSFERHFREEIVLYIGFVGSRRYMDEKNVRRVVRSILDQYDIAISGGAKGPDKWSEDEAKKLKAKTKIFRPKIKKGMKKYEIINAYYARNREIVEYSDIIHAFVVDDKGGTWNTIQWAKKLGKMVIIHKDKESYILEDNAQ